MKDLILVSENDLENVVGGKEFKDLDTIDKAIFTLTTAVLLADLVLLTSQLCMAAKRSITGFVAKRKASKNHNHA